MPTDPFSDLEKGQGTGDDLDSPTSPGTESSTVVSSLRASLSWSIAGKHSSAMKNLQSRHIVSNRLFRCVGGAQLR